ncbi:MAG TPA: helix-turn-helix domain-containing protein [Devosia sp.]
MRQGRLRRRGGRLTREMARQVARDEAAIRVLELVGRARGVSRSEMLSQRRCGNEVAAARQLAMYLVHTLLGRSYLEVAGLFGRDRTTVSYACARIEDRREEKSPFEGEVETIEIAVMAWREGTSHAAG